MSIFETVQITLAKQLEISPDLIKPETRILEDLGADSLDLVELVMTLEESYNILITADKGAELKTVGAIVEFIESRINK